MINATALNYIVDSKQFPLFIAGGVAAAIVALFYQFTRNSSPLPSGATIANIHQDGNYGDSRNQIVFNEWFADTVEKTKTLIKNSGQDSVRSILEFIGKERRRIAKQLSHYNSSLYGHLRGVNVPMYTPITADNRYAPYLDRCLELFFKEHGPFQGFLPKNPDPIHLSKIDWRQPCIAICHADVSEKENQEIISFLTHKTHYLLQNDELTTEQIIHTLGSMHWWLAQTMLFQRGSACITEVFIQAIASLKGFPSTHWKPNIMPDLEAILSEHDDFVDRYEEILLLN